MPRIVAIVEGHGEVAAVPILIRRIAAVASPGVHVDVPPPIRIKRQRFLQANELERTVELAARQSGPAGRILILLDADRECPKDLAPKVLARAQQARGDRAIRVVLAKPEYEVWFLAAASSIAGHRGIGPATTAPANPESIGNAKGWLSRRMHAGRSYRETLDQPALTTVFDLGAARGASPSFDKMWRDVAALL